MGTGESLSVSLQSNEGRGLFLCTLRPGALRPFLDLCGVRSIPEVTDLHMRGLCFKALEFTRKHLESNDPLGRRAQEHQEFCDKYDTRKSYVDFKLQMSALEPCEDNDCLRTEITLMHAILEPRTLDFNGLSEEG